MIFIESYDHRDAQLAKRMTSNEWIASVKTMQPLINTKVLVAIELHKILISCSSISSYKLCMVQCSK